MPNVKNRHRSKTNRSHYLVSCWFGEYSARAEFTTGDIILWDVELDTPDGVIAFVDPYSELPEDILLGLVENAQDEYRFGLS